MNLSEIMHATLSHFHGAFTMLGMGEATIHRK